MPENKAFAIILLSYVTKNIFFIYKKAIFFHLYTLYM